jgi:hypothetical protein
MRKDVRVESGAIKVLNVDQCLNTLSDRSRAEGHYFLVEEFFQLLAADVVLVHYETRQVSSLPTSWG